MTDQDKFPAEWVVFWPGKQVYACDKHLDDLQAVNRAIGGGHLSFRNLHDIGEEGPCSNCVNEAKSAEAREKHGVTEQDIAETMPPTPQEER